MGFPNGENQFNLLLISFHGKNGTSKKRELLFTVDASFQQDQVVEIDALIEKLKKELKVN